MPTTMRIPLSRKQKQFRESTALFRALSGGRGAGKSWVGAYDLIRRAKPGRVYGVYAPTYRMMMDATLRTFMTIGESLHYIASFGRADMRVVLGNGAEVIFRSLDDPQHARGPNLSGAWVDEASLVGREAFDILIGCLRQHGEMGWLSATFTPKGRRHWTYTVFAGDSPDVGLVTAPTRSNPFLPAVFYETLRAQYTSLYAEQELEGRFVDLDVGLARREWFRIVDAAPTGGRRVRAWDFAATERAVKGDDPDCTVGTLLCLADGVYYVQDVIAVRAGPGAVERLVMQTAEVDGRDVVIVLEQEPGASGKLFTRSLIRMLAGWSVRVFPASGDKVTRAMPFLAQAEAGNVRLVRGGWVADWLEEVGVFPHGEHDDQVDSVALAFNYLTGRAGWARGPAL